LIRTHRSGRAQRAAAAATDTVLTHGLLLVGTIFELLSPPPLLLLNLLCQPIKVRLPPLLLNGSSLLRGIRNTSDGSPMSPMKFSMRRRSDAENECFSSAMKSASEDAPLELSPSPNHSPLKGFDCHR
jgi:hypothetical protein